MSNFLNIDFHGATLNVEYKYTSYVAETRYEPAEEAEVDILSIEAGDVDISGLVDAGGLWEELEEAILSDTSNYEER